MSFFGKDNTQKSGRERLESLEKDSLGEETRWLERGRSQDEKDRRIRVTSDGKIADLEDRSTEIEGNVHKNKSAIRSIESRAESTRKENRFAHSRAVVWSIICSGIVALFISYTFETQANKVSCQDSNRDRTVLVSVANTVTKTSDDPAVRARWAGFRDQFQMGIRDCEGIFESLPFVK